MSQGENQGAEEHRHVDRVRHADWASHTRLVCRLGLGVLAGIACINAVVDPFGVYRLPGTRALDPYREEYESRIARAEILQHSECEIVILGTSRAQLALDPTSSVWDRPTCNLAITGASIAEVAETFRYALQFRDVREIFWTIDFLSFEENARFNPEFFRSRFNSALSLFQYHGALLLGSGALRASWGVIKDLRADRRAAFGPLGGPRERVTKWERDYHARFEGSLERDLRSLTSVQIPRRYAPSNVELLFGAVETALERGVRVTLVSLPSHALHFEGLRRTRHWSEFERWKRDLVRVRTRRGLERVELWDCTHFLGLPAERVPTARARNEQMTWHWDSVHAKREYGDRVVAWVRAAGSLPAVSTSPPQPTEVGEPEKVATSIVNERPGSEGACDRLTEASIEAVLLRLRRERSAYAAEHPEQLELLQAVFERSVPAALRPDSGE